MRSHYRAIVIAISLAASTLVCAQSGTTNNPAGRARDGDVFYYGPMQGQRSAFGRGALDNTGIGRPNPRGRAQVTPVPEPSQWAMMLAGLALVGYIVRRNSRSSRDRDA